MRSTHASMRSSCPSCPLLAHSRPRSSRTYSRIRSPPRSGVRPHTKCSKIGDRGPVHVGTWYASRHCDVIGTTLYPFAIYINPKMSMSMSMSMGRTTWVLTQGPCLGLIDAPPGAQPHIACMVRARYIRIYAPLTTCTHACSVTNRACVQCRCRFDRRCGRRRPVWRCSS